MFSTQKLFVVASLLSLTAVVAQEHNITVPDTDPSIAYAGTGTGDALICKVDANGNFVGGQAGCYFIPSKCTSSVAMSQNLDHQAAATFKFKGSAIYINSALYDISPVYTITLDGKATDADGVRASNGFTCAQLFSQTNLDPAVEHTVSLSVKGPSPNRNMTVDPDGSFGVFSLIDFTYTVPDAASSSNTTSSPPATDTSIRANAGPTMSASSISTSGTTPNSTPKGNAAAAADARTLSTLLLGVFALGVGVMQGAIFS